MRVSIAMVLVVAFAACGASDDATDATTAADTAASTSVGDDGGDAHVVTTSATTGMATLLTGVGDGSSGDDAAAESTGAPLDPGYAADVEPIVAAHCQGNCHQLDWSLDLRPGMGHASLVSHPSDEHPTMPRVTPGDPSQSFLWHKVMGTHLEVGGEGDRMPRIGPPLSSAELAAVESWILDGAQP